MRRSSAPPDHGHLNLKGACRAAPLGLRRYPRTSRRECNAQLWGTLAEHYFLYRANVVRRTSAL